MAAVTEENVRRVEQLLDMLGGDDYLGRTEPRESGPVGTHEPCLGHNENLARWNYCPECNGEGLVRSRSGTIDPYLLAPYGVASESPPTPDQAHAASATEPVKLTEVERHVSRNLRVRHALQVIANLQRRAPVFDSYRLYVEWIVKRMHWIPRV
jgi:hypothetical protein